MICTFFGHRDAPETIEQILRKVLVDLIENKGVKMFYVGNKGQFDLIVRNVLEKLSEQYEIDFYIVLAYMPKENPYGNLKTILPGEIEKSPQKFAIDYRNRWMIKQADYVVTYIRNHIGSGAAKYKELAIKQGKKIIELYGN